MSRDYKKEYESYHKNPEQRARRSSRNKARRLAIKKHGKAAVKGKDIHHVNNNPLDNKSSNLRIESKSKNRSRKT